MKLSANVVSRSSIERSDSVVSSDQLLFLSELSPTVLRWGRIRHNQSIAAAPVKNIPAIVAASTLAHSSTLICDNVLPVTPVGQRQKAIAHPRPE
jgi:hypothetical protein